MRAIPVLAVLAVAGLAFVAFAWLVQRRLMYFPDPTHPPRAASLVPGAVDVAFRAEDGTALTGWWRAPEPGTDGTTVVVFNGNAGHRALRAPLAGAFAAAGFGVLLFDYRGYGGNPGRPTESGLVSDGRAAVRWASMRPGVHPARLVFYGESLGAAVAVAVATTDAPAALVLRSPFTSMADVGSVHYPWLPVRLLLKDRYPSSERIAAVGRPLLVIAGDEDRIVPASQSRALFEAAATSKKRFVSLPGVGHNDPTFSSPEVMAQVVAFVREATAESAHLPEEP